MPPTLFHADARKILPTLETASVDVVLTDPPYPEINRDYGRLTERDWHAMMDEVIPQIRRVLKPTGSAVFILQSNAKKLGQMRTWLWEFMAKWGKKWNLIQDIYWWNTAAIPDSFAIQGQLCRASIKACVWLGPSDCYRQQKKILWSETDRNKSLRASIRSSNNGKTYVSPSGHWHNENTIAAAAERRGGVTPYNLIPLPNTNSTSSGGASGHGASTPFALCEWWIKYLCPQDGVVLDPFMGSGTVGIAALNLGLSFIGIEQCPRLDISNDPDYFAMANSRINDPIPKVSEHETNELSFFDILGD